MPRTLDIKKVQEAVRERVRGGQDAEGERERSGSWLLVTYFFQQLSTSLSRFHNLPKPAGDHVFKGDCEQHDALRSQHFLIEM